MTLVLLVATMSSEYLFYPNERSAGSFYFWEFLVRFSDAQFPNSNQIQIKSYQMTGLLSLLQSEDWIVGKPTSCDIYMYILIYVTFIDKINI